MAAGLPPPRLAATPPAAIAPAPRTARAIHRFLTHHGVNLLAFLQVLSLFIKIALFIFLFMWVRWTVPRFRYDQLMKLGWKTMIPLALLNMLVTGFVILLKQNHWHF